MTTKKPARYQKNHPDPRKRPPVVKTYKRKAEKVETPHRDICGLSGDLMEMVAKATEKRRMDLWRQEHKETMSPMLAEFAKVVARAPDYDTSVFDYEIQAHAAMGGVDAGGYEIDEEYAVEAQGAEWIDGREIVWHGAWDETYAGHLAGLAKSR